MELELSEEQREWCTEALVSLRSKTERHAKNEYGLLTALEARNFRVEPCEYPFCRTSSRVFLSEAPSEVVDANFISQSFGGPVSICAGQPEHSPVFFWMMVLQQNCKAIVKLTEDRPVEYFPTGAGDSNTYGDISVTNLSSRISKYGVVQRQLKVEWPAKQKSVIVDHFQMSWPDCQVLRRIEPVQEILAALYRIDSGSYVVHCRAGIGRAGTLVTLDNILRRILCGDLSAVNVFETVEQLRERRRALVETPDQYWFCFRALIAELEFLLACNQRKETSYHYTSARLEV